MTTLVVGGAACVWDDVDAAMALFAPTAVIAVNDIAIQWDGPLDIWATLHPEKLPLWAAERRRRGLPAPGAVWSHRAQAPLVSHHRPDLGGSSGMFAAYVARDAFGGQVVLAGVPMDGAIPHLVRGETWRQVGGYWPAWLAHAADLATFCRSLSGRTRDLLGPPTEAWLASR